ncbi:MAG: element excision factor XisH family protein [Saprospiraceae bacterium]
MARDLLHDSLREALIKDNWKITHDPYRISIEDVGYEVDLGAEKLIAATNGADKILVEVKSFRGQSLTYEFHRALGQFNSYIVPLLEKDPERTLFLAVPMEVFNSFFQKMLIQKTLEFYHVKILVFDPSQNVIVQWIKY